MPIKYFIKSNKRMLVHIPWGVIGGLFYFHISPIFMVTMILVVLLYQVLYGWRNTTFNFQGVLGIAWGLLLIGLVYLVISFVGDVTPAESIRHLREIPEGLLEK